MFNVKIIFLLLIASSYNANATYDDGRVAFDQGNFHQAYQLWLETATAKTAALDNSFQWTITSSVQQRRNSQYAIAILYWQGKGVDQNYAQAAKWLKLALEAGHMKAQLKLGFLYLQGLGVEKDEKKARKKFIIAAEHGFIDAQYNLGILCLMGVGGERNISKAKFWLKQAALQGDGQAFEELMKFQENTEKEMFAEIDNKTDESIDIGHIENPEVLKKTQLHEPTWLLEQADKIYAVQVLAMSSLQQLEGFIAILPVTGDWVYFVKQKERQKFYILLRCCFQDKKVANEFRQEFSSVKKICILF